MNQSHILVAFALLILPAPLTAVHAATHVVEPDGSGDFPTIQDAVDAAQGGDVIELTDGVFTGAGNRDIDFSGKAITVCSQNGNPEDCIIDVQGVHDQITQQGFYLHSGEGAGSVIKDLTITNGVADGP